MAAVQSRQMRRRVLLTIAAALVAGGLAGVGVALDWYPPVVGVVAAAVIGAGVGIRMQALR